MFSIKFILKFTYKYTYSIHQINDEPFHIGGDDEHSGTSFYIDELKFYNENLKCKGIYKFIITCY